jgi:ankyrin repeat protein
MDLFSEVMRYWARMHRGLSAEAQKDFERVFDHIAGAFEIMVQQQWGNQMLCSAASYGCLPMMERLFSAARSNPALRAEILRAPHRDAASRSKTAFHHQSIGDAAWNGRTATVAFLLEQEGIDAHLRYVDVVGNNVFHKAARCGDVEMFRLLVSRFPEGVNHRNKDDDMPLQLLVFERSKHDVVKFLLEEAHADVLCGITSQDSHWKEPLRMATRYGDLDMCRILVRSGGADPMSVFERQGETLAFKDPMENMEIAAQLQQCLLSLV